MEGHKRTMKAQGEGACVNTQQQHIGNAIIERRQTGRQDARGVMTSPRGEDGRRRGRGRGRAERDYTREMTVEKTALLGLQGKSKIIRQWLSGKLEVILLCNVLGIIKLELSEQP